MVSLRRHRAPSAGDHERRSDVVRHDRRMVADCGHGRFFVVGGFELRALLAESLSGSHPTEAKEQLGWRQLHQMDTMAADGETKNAPVIANGVWGMDFGHGDASDGKSELHPVLAFAIQ